MTLCANEFPSFSSVALLHWLGDSNYEQQLALDKICNRMKTMKKKIAKNNTEKKAKAEKNRIECDRGRARSWANGKYEHKWNVF